MAASVGLVDASTTVAHLRPRGNRSRQVGSPEACSGGGVKPRTLVTTSAAVAATAVAGSIASQDVGGRWYRRLDKPAFQPPGAVFPVVWTALYTDIAVTTATAS